MKRLTLLITIATICIAATAQNRHSILFSGEYVHVPSYQLHGVGYTLAFQQQIHEWFYVEGGASYAIASNRNKRDEVVNNIQLLDLYYHHASYNFYAAPLSKVSIGDRVVFDLFVGPVLTYQSNVVDINHYKIIEGSESISNHPDHIYKNESQEGSFFGGIAGIRFSVFLRSNWSLFAGGNVKGIIEGESSVNASIGLSYNWFSFR